MVSHASRDSLQESKISDFEVVDMHDAQYDFQNMENSLQMMQPKNQKNRPTFYQGSDGRRGKFGGFIKDIFKGKKERTGKSFMSKVKKGERKTR